MTCRSCGATIADKAIVCYRCGTPTAEPAMRTSTPARGRPRWLAVIVMLAIIALGVWLLPMTPAGSSSRWVGWAVLIVVTAIAAFWLRGGRTPRRPV